MNKMITINRSSCYRMSCTFRESTCTNNITSSCRISVYINIEVINRRTFFFKYAYQVHIFLDIKSPIRTNRHNLIRMILFPTHKVITGSRFSIKFNLTTSLKLKPKSIRTFIRHNMRTSTTHNTAFFRRRS